MDELPAELIPSVLTDKQKDDILTFASELIRIPGESGCEEKNR